MPKRHTGDQCRRGVFVRWQESERQDERRGRVRREVRERRGEEREFREKEFWESEEGIERERKRG